MDIVTLDASKHGEYGNKPGLGAYNFENHEYYHRAVPGYMVDWDIGDLELVNHLVVARVWGPSWHGVEVTGFTDNQSAMHLLRHGRSRSELRLDIAREFASIQQSYQFLWNSDYVSTKDNLLSDCLSTWGCASARNKFFQHTSGFPTSEYLFLTASSTYLITGNLGNPADLSLDELRRITQDIQSNAFALRTKKNLNSMFRAFMQFCTFYRISGAPASGDELCLFATWLYVSGRVHSVQSVRNYLSAVRTWHRGNGLDCPTPTTFTPLGLTIRGLERKFSTPVRKMSPITPNILLSLVQYPSNIFGTEWKIFTVIRSLYVHLFLSMLRLDNMVPQSTGCFNPDVQLVWSRVVKLGQGVVIRATHTKQIQDRRRTLEVPLVAKPGS